MDKNEWLLAIIIWTVIGLCLMGWVHIANEGFKLLGGN